MNTRGQLKVTNPRPPIAFEIQHKIQITPELIKKLKPKIDKSTIIRTKILIIIVLHQYLTAPAAFPL